MIGRLVACCLRRRWLVMTALVALSAFGLYALRQLNVEAYPDIGDVTAQVITQYPGHAAEEVEQQITIPLERELNGTPGLHVMRSKSTADFRHFFFWRRWIPGTARPSPRPLRQRCGQPAAGAALDRRLEPGCAATTPPLSRPPSAPHGRLGVLPRVRPPHRQPPGGREQGS
jgi:hypothetical protein